MSKSNGYVIYDGPSQIDGQRIVAIVTGIKKRSSNAKTGGMVQTYILRPDMSPIDASRTGADVSICGDCQHRGVADGTKAKGRTCYVFLGQGPLSVWRAYQRGVYMAAPADVVAMLVEGRMVRLGTYGDPAAVPAGVWQALIAMAKGHTGYTHQWQSLAATGRGAVYASLTMASADSPEEMELARALGWRTFRVRTAKQGLEQGEAACPASEEAGRKLTCDTCGACNGAGTGRKGSIAIIAHGLGARTFAKAND